MDKEAELKLLQAIEDALPPPFGLLPSVAYFDKGYKKVIEISEAHYIRFNSQEQREFLKKELRYKRMNEIEFFYLKKTRKYLSQLTQKVVI
jgi:hypothetical protein